ncbi:MAG: TIGR02757 family protein [Elusimicrobiota bacterium]
MKDKHFFEEIYKNYHKSEFIYSDPIQFPHRFKRKMDIEVAGFISSSLSYGNVKQIINSLNKIFQKMGESPFYYLKKSSAKKIEKDFKNFNHRFTKGKELVLFLLNLKRIYSRHRSLNEFFIKHYNNTDEFLDKAIYNFSKEFSFYPTPTLIPSPFKKSAFKRLNLFLRWMIRKDEIDFGIWEKIPPSTLIIPLDTHMLNISNKLNITKRKDSSMKTAIEITNFFRKINPSDPVKYDFSLTRAPILRQFI